MKFNIKTKKEMEKRLSKIPLWRLIILASKCEQTMIEKKKAGMKNMSSLKKIRNVRSVYRNVLLSKLRKWKKGEMDEMSFFELQTYNKDQEFMEIESELLGVNQN